MLTRSTRSARTMTLRHDSPEILAALAAWHKSDRASFERLSPRFNHDAYCPKTAKDGKRWLKMNNGDTGVYLVDLTSPAADVYTIKGDGVPHRRIGTLAELTAAWMRQGTAGCDCITSGNEAKPKQHGADPHAKNCQVYLDTHRKTPVP